jgi:uncharacterized RDD family membrane protein YckC
MTQTIIKTEETLIIETPERVELEFALASIGNRFIAALIDHLIQIFLIILTWYLIVTISQIDYKDFFKSSDETQKWAIALGLLVLFSIFFGYFALFEWRWNGQTPGKKIVKLRVIREDGRPITFWEASVRNILRIVDSFPGFIIPLYSIGLICIFLNNRDQRIGDLFAGTVVIREHHQKTFSELISEPLNDIAFTRYKKKIELQFDLSKLTEEEILVVETFLRRRLDMNEKSREWMAWRLALPLMRKLKPVYETKDFSYEGFLEELVHRYYNLIEKQP